MQVIMMYTSNILPDFDAPLDPPLFAWQIILAHAHMVIMCIICLIHAFYNQPYSILKT